MAGLMPHPEHAIDELTGPRADGLGFFTSVLQAVAVVMTSRVRTPWLTPRSRTPWTAPQRRRTGPSPSPRSA